MMTPVWLAVGRRRAGALASLALVVLVALSGGSAPMRSQRSNVSVCRKVSPPRPGVHPVSGRRIASVMSHAGAEWLDRPERESEERPDRAIEALRLRPGAVVADLGAGSGYFTVRLARRVGPAGRVFAADIQPEMLSLLRTRLSARHFRMSNWCRAPKTIRGFRRARFDLILMVDVYHELAQPQVILSKLLTSLKPAGRLVLLEYRKEDPTVPIRPEHKMSVADARLELEAEGFQLDRVDRTPAPPAHPHLSPSALKPRRRAASRLARILFFSPEQDHNHAPGPSHSDRRRRDRRVDRLRVHVEQHGGRASPAKCELTATNSTPEFQRVWRSGRIAVLAARECVWTAAAQVSWVALMPPAEGQGESTLKYNVQTNPSGLPRRGPST